jgi:uncharacterized protein (DUF305 family)
MKSSPISHLPAACALALSAVVFAASAQAPGGQANMNMSKPQGGESQSTQAFKAAQEKMMKNMPEFTGNADQDFVAHMIPHHQGAVDAAEVELKYGKDPAMRKLAGEIIKAQKKEIAFMKKWQQKHPAR